MESLKGRYVVESYFLKTFYNFFVVMGVRGVSLFHIKKTFRIFCCSIRRFRYGYSNWAFLETALMDIPMSKPMPTFQSKPNLCKGCKIKPEHMKVLENRPTLIDV